jgi:hypothetical protein
MPKAFAEVKGSEVNAGNLLLNVAITITDDNGRVLASPEHGVGQRTIPQVSIPFGAGSAATAVNNIEARVIAVAAGIGITLGVADIMITNLAQGA